MKNLGLLVYDMSLTGGAERVAWNLAEEFSSQYHVTLISIFDKNKWCGRPYSFPTIVLSNHYVSLTQFLFPLASKLRNYIKSNSIDILIAITAGVVTIADLAAARTSTKVVYAEHSNLENTTYGRKHQLRQYIGAKCSDMVVALTERDKNNFLKKYKLAADKICVIPNWYEPETMTKKPYKTEAKKLISVGRLERVKGYHYLIEVAEQIYLLFPDWKWDIYGDGTLYKEIQSQIKKKHLENFITLKGNVTGLAAIYQEYSIYVMTSQYEGLPMALLEAQTAGLPIVSFDCPTGPAEIVCDGVNGRIVEAYHTKKMAAVLKRLMSESKLRERYAAKAGIDLDRYCKENVRQQWIDLFNKMC